MLGGLMGAQAGIGIAKKLFGGIFGGGKKKKLKKKLKAMKQQMQQMKQQMAHMAGFNRGLMAGMGMRGMQGCGANQMNLCASSFNRCQMPQASLSAVSVSMSLSAVNRGIC